MFLVSLCGLLGQMSTRTLPSDVQISEGLVFLEYG